MEISEIIRLAIAEDIGTGDHTSLATIPEFAIGNAKLIARQPGILAGLPFAMEVFRQTDPVLNIKVLLQDGACLASGDIVCTVAGASRSIVAAERLALNIVQRLSGIATFTASLCKLIEGYQARLLDTRKTTPLLREMEKYAVRTGGGYNHRMGLYDMIMIKDNHVDYAGGIAQAIVRVNQYLLDHQLDLKVEIEVRNMSELEQVLEVGQVHRIMLDNFTPDELASALQRIHGLYETEASGGITEANIREYAATGVDYISVGALTHQIRSLDLSLKAC
jgi:nicotinate-nucleotide pyrophosphorylase (carboxylating)